MSERVTHIGNYRIERELMQEERRTVYQGWQMSLNRPVQITQLTSEAAADVEFLTRWKLVARDLRDPGHPQVPRILDAQFSGEHPYLVESYLVADTLADHLTTGKDLNTSLRLVAGIADALGYAHKRGWAHGKLGLDSVRVMEDGSAYLMDLPWQAAQRPKGDTVAMQGDVQALLGLLSALRQPIAGTAQPLTGRAADDTQSLVTWLARGEPPESAGTAQALAPVLLRALTGGIVTCDQLAESLRPLAPGLKAAEAAPAPPSGTIVLPPPGSASRQPPPAPQPVPLAPVIMAASQPPTPAPPPPIAAPMPRQGGSRRGVVAALTVVVILAVLAAGGVLLCKTGVLPFCVSCNESLIAQYLSGARVFVEREAWSDAQRELQSASNECAACSVESASCSDAQQLQEVAACHFEFESLVATGEKLLGNDDACLAVEKLEQALDRAPACEADVSLSRSFLARASDGGAYTLCAQEQLALAETESNSDKRGELCLRAYDFLSKAHKLKPTTSSITQLYTQAERFATLQSATNAGDWDSAATALDELQAVVQNGPYCGYELDEFHFNILTGQGDKLLEQNLFSEAFAKFQTAEPLAGTLAQKDRVAKAIARIPAEAITPPATPTLVATPTDAATPTPFVASQGANIRACPNTGCPVKRKTAQGTALSTGCYVTEKDGKWYKVDLGGDEGWARADVVTLKGTLPVCPAGEITPTPEVAAQPTPRPQQQSSGGSCRADRSLPALTLNSPGPDQTCNGPVRFSWQASYGLQPGEVFEVHIWPDRNQTKANVKQTRDTSTVIDLRSDVRWISWNEKPHFWEVVVVCKANGRVISQDVRARLLYFWPAEPYDPGNPDGNCR